MADAWSRTSRVQVEATSPSGPVTLRSGLVLLARPDDDTLPRLPLTSGMEPLRQLDRSLCEIGERYGAARRDWVMQEMEYPRGRLQCGPVPGSTGKPSAPSSSIDSASSSSVASARVAGVGAPHQLGDRVFAELLHAVGPNVVAGFDHLAVCRGRTPIIAAAGSSRSDIVHAISPQNPESPCPSPRTSADSR